METKGKKKFNLNFDLLQKLGKVLMTVIAVMPAAGLMISIGKLVQMAGADLSIVMTIGSTMENIGWAVINNLHILFAVAIGGSWAKERAGGAFAALITFILINQITGSIFGVTSDMLNDATAVTHTLFGKEILVNGYFTSVLGVPALKHGCFCRNYQQDSQEELFTINIIITANYRMHYLSSMENASYQWYVSHGQ